MVCLVSLPHLGKSCLGYLAGLRVILEKPRLGRRSKDQKKPAKVGSPCEKSLMVNLCVSVLMEAHATTRTRTVARLDMAVG